MLLLIGDILFKSLGIIVSAVILYLGALIIFQRQYIYFPSQYDEIFPEQIPGLEKISYKVQNQPQTAFYIPAKTGKPKCLWVMIGGNAALALGWLNLVDQNQDDTAFLLVDYPGYGLNEGTPNFEGNVQAPQAAYSALISQYGEPEKLGVVGHSLGASVATYFALNQSVSSLILLSPFTSMQDMVSKVMPLFSHILNYWLTEKYIVMDHLNQLRVLNDKLNITMIHGDSDTIVPVMMSRSMAEKYAWIKYIELQGANHNFIQDYLLLIRQEMQSLCQ